VLGDLRGLAVGPAKCGVDDGVFALGDVVGPEPHGFVDGEFAVGEVVVRRLDAVGVEARAGSALQRRSEPLGYPRAAEERTPITPSPASWASSIREEPVELVARPLEPARARPEGVRAAP
jgi:hypothetical protein